VIIITGDSWGCGEWENMEIVHGGLGQYLKEHGFKVINLSLGSSSNNASYQRLEQFLANGATDYLPKISHVIFFQTDWTRDFRINSEISGIGMEEQWFFPKQKIEDLRSFAICRILYRLSDLAKKYNLKISLIGGLSDTIWLDLFEKEYPGLEILCQSFSNLCVNNNHRVEKPVHTLNPDAVDLLKKTRPEYASKNLFVEDISLALERYDLFANNKAMFWPDGQHPNRIGHKKLFEFIISSNFLQK